MTEVWVAQDDEGAILCQGSSYEEVLDMIPTQLENELIVRKLS